MTRRWRPRSMIILLAAFLIGALIPAGVFWLLDTLNTTLRGRKDLEGLSIPFLGEIPLRDKKDNSEILVHKNKRIRCRRRSARPDEHGVHAYEGEEMK
jgi:hypothetical protein